jgi:hypothetical protein
MLELGPRDLIPHYRCGRGGPATYFMFYRRIRRRIDEAGIAYFYPVKGYWMCDVIYPPNNSHVASQLNLTATVFL